MLTRRTFERIACMLMVSCAVGGTLTAGDEPSCHHGGGGAQEASSGGATEYTRVEKTYRVPDLTLLDQQGREVKLEQALDGSRPVALNFIFTTCTTICPVMAATFSRLQHELGDDIGDLRLVSISIDPEYDRPEVLAEYAARFEADDRWEFLTGSQDQIASVLQAFDALIGSKVNHRPLTFFKAPQDDAWVRIEGLPAASTLADEYRRILQH